MLVPIGAIAIFMAVFALATLRKVHLGIVMFPAACAVGVVLAGMPLREVVGGFPIGILVLVAGVTYFFGIAGINGTVDRVIAALLTRMTANVRGTRAGALLGDGVATLAALLLSFAAFDDITTGHETDVRLEYAALLVCASWLLLVACRLVRESHRVLGAMSFFWLAGALLGQREIGPGTMPGLWPAYVATAGAFLWFIFVAVIQFVSGWRAHTERDTQRA